MRRVPCRLRDLRQAVSALGACHDGHLAILLTTDDGFDRPGIQTLRDALAAAGHHDACAPPHDYSGTGAALSLSGPIEVHKVGDHTLTTDLKLLASPERCAAL